MNGTFRKVSQSWPRVKQKLRPAPHSFTQASGWSVFIPFRSSSPPGGTTTGVCAFGQPARR
jgi:hypothetical protein